MKMHMGRKWWEKEGDGDIPSGLWHCSGLLSLPKFPPSFHLRGNFPQLLSSSALQEKSQ